MIEWKLKKNHDGSSYLESDCGRYRLLNKGKEDGNKYCLQGKIGKDGYDYGLFCITYLFEDTLKKVKKKANELELNSA